MSLTRGRFPRLAECAHFHYENVDFGSVQLSLAEDQSELTRGDSLDPKELTYLVQICCQVLYLLSIVITVCYVSLAMCQGRKWMVKRLYEDFRVLDKHLHLCIYDRNFSQLLELPRFDDLRDKSEPLSQMLTAYLSRLSFIADNKINCGPALTWMEVVCIDNKGNHLLVHDESSINVPAVAAAHVLKRYTAQAADELSFEVGDIVSVIDMPPKEDTGWWRGKHGFQVGFFPGECVELISEKVPPNMTGSLPKPVCKKHGKLITFLRSFVKSRPTKQKLKQCGILRERVFGCDLGEHLLNSGHDGERARRALGCYQQGAPRSSIQHVISPWLRFLIQCLPSAVPQVIKSCAEFIEKHGVVDGIYRLSGVASNIQKLRHEFDSEHVPDLSKDVSIQDIHSVGSLCKLYFRELPNPLLTYQLYDRFSDAVSVATDDERLVKIHDVIQQLPPPHYRTLEFLMRHLAYMATLSNITNMHCKNLAIVWAPNLLRSKHIESACFGGTSAFMEVRVQSVVVEFILSHVEELFSHRLSTLIRESSGHGTVMRPKSLLVCSPSTKLLSLEQAQARTQTQLTLPVFPDGKYMEVGEGPAALQGKFHTVIDLPTERKKTQNKARKSPVLSWRSFFSMGKSSTATKCKLLHRPSEPSEIKTAALQGQDFSISPYPRCLLSGRGDSGTMRSAKSEESLSSHTHEGGSGVYRVRRPRSTSDALSVSFSEDLLNSRGHGGSQSGGKDPAAPHPADAHLAIEPPSQTSDARKEGGRKRERGRPGEAARWDGRAGLTVPPDLPPQAQEDANRMHSADVAAATKATSPLMGPGESTGAEECPTSSRQGEAGTRDEPAHSLKRAGTGAVIFDCTPGLVRSVSLIAPQPAGKSAARVLALALAESAQQAARLRKRGSSEPPTPLSPLRLQDPLSLLQWPSAPTKDPCIPQGNFTGSPSAVSAGNHTESSSPRSTCACRGSESGLSCSDGGDAPGTGRRACATPPDPSSVKGADAERALESQASIRENIRHVGVGTDAGGPETELCEGLEPRRSPTEDSSACHASEDCSATAALLSKQAANASNFRAILAEATMPSSVQEVLPQAPVTSPSSAYQYSPKDASLLGSSGLVYPQPWCSPPGQSGPYRPGYQQLQAESFSKDRYSTLTPRSLHLSFKYKGHQRMECSPGRVYGYGGPRYPPMDGASVYPTIRRVRSIHAPPEDKFFFFQHPSCQNNPYQTPVPSDIHRVRPYFEDGKVQYRYSPFLEAQQSDPDARRVNGHRRSHAYTTHRPPFRSAGVTGSVQSHRDPWVKPPFARERSFVKQDVGPLPRGRDGTVYEALDAGLSDPHFSQSVRQGNVWNKRLPDLAVGPAHLLRGAQSKSEPGNDMLISTEGADGKYRVTMVRDYSPEHPLPEPEACQPEWVEKRGFGHGAKAALMLKQSCSMLCYPQPPVRYPGLQKEHSCPDFKRSESSEAGVCLRGQNRLAFQTLGGCPAEDSQRAKVRCPGLQRSDRSQSARGHHQESYAKRTLERDYRLAYPTQRRPRTCSMSVPSRPEYADACVSKPVRARMGVFPNYGCMPPQSRRLYPTALGPGGFLPSELRPETEIYAE
ncbi:hypothetical protein P4O66_017627 [Electrophorus voltai]|uniref:Rho GTPase activating protein 32a n=1 Tax=Electrophorus voltai TaxID=2609070 RepID=A0AAD8YUX0_9TELE|nr:hypothetical protein P4O66_017627 [Electrophorus voltai]